MPNFVGLKFLNETLISGVLGAAFKVRHTIPFVKEVDENLVPDYYEIVEDPKVCCINALTIFSVAKCVGEVGIAYM